LCGIESWDGNQIAIGNGRASALTAFHNQVIQCDVGRLNALKRVATNKTKSPDRDAR